MKKKQTSYQGGVLVGFFYDKTVDTYEVPTIKIQDIDF